MGDIHHRALDTTPAHEAETAYFRMRGNSSHSESMPQSSTSHALTVAQRARCQAEQTYASLGARTTCVTDACHTSSGDWRRRSASAGDGSCLPRVVDTRAPWVSRRLLPQSRLVWTMAPGACLGPDSTLSAAGARHTGGRPLPLVKRTGEVSPVPGSPVAVATRGAGCDPRHSTRWLPLSLGSSALAHGHASPALAPACGRTALWPGAPSWRGAVWAPCGAAGLVERCISAIDPPFLRCVHPRPALSRRARQRWSTSKRLRETA
jgi:hypothetical protein